MLSRKTSCLLLALAFIASGSAACGRKGDLDRPGTPAAQTNVKGSDDGKNAVVDRPFLLDPLL